MTHALSNIIDLINAPTPPRWFEFVFEPDRLAQHLDLCPIELITSFFKNMPEFEVGSAIATITQSNTNNGVNDNAEQNELCDVIIPPDSYELKYRLRKTYALKVLAIKVACHLKWDLDALCEGLTIPIQCKLMQAFKDACYTEECPPEVKMFASIIYCRWFLRSAIAYKLFSLQPQSTSTIIYLSQLQQQQQTADTLALMNMSDLFSEARLESHVDELHDYIWKLTQHKDNSTKRQKTTSHPFKKAKLSRPKLGCFDTRAVDFNNWEECEPIEPIEFIEAACYDLGRSLFFEERYLQAKEVFELIKGSKDKFPLLEGFLQSAGDILTVDDKPTDEEEDDEHNKMSDQSMEGYIENCDKSISESSRRRRQTEKYLFDCMNHYGRNRNDIGKRQSNDSGEDYQDAEPAGLTHPHQLRLPENSAWYLQVPVDQHQQRLLEMGKGDLFMSRDNYKQAMSCFVGALMLQTDYFRVFSKNYIEEEPFITRMIQCSISLSCYTQAVALCQMTKSLNYTIAFKQLNERLCNDCCDDIYECIWNITLLEYIISLHARRGEVDRRIKATQLIGQLELNENNPEDILKEAEHVRRGKFFRILSNKYL